MNENERDNEPEEEGEYHFSDETGYEVGEEESKAPLVTEKTGLAAQFASYRRFIILGGVFAAILLVVYLVISPPVTVPSPEIQEAATPPPVVQAAPIEETSPPAKVVAKPEQASRVKTMMASLEASKTKAEAYIESPKPPLSSILPTTPPPLQNITPPSSALPPPPPQTNPDSGSKMIAERLQALEETNARLISQLNSDYSHKLGEFESQDKAMEEKIRTLNARIETMEARISQLLQGIHKQEPHAAVDSSGPGPNEGNTSFTLPSSALTPPKSNYSVQAIIPGRAWLRAENGETITVAEGDILKNFGRVTKIDPYDGTIQIDTGSKVLTLTYGSGDYT